METKIKKFLEFNGKTIFFVDVNGTSWIAVKPICEALGVNYNRQFQNLKEDENLSSVFAKQQMQVPTDDQKREYICLPEKYIYGWIFSLNSQSEELKLYKMKCYDVLFDYFHGTITKRKEFLTQRNDLDARLNEINLKLKEENELIQERNKLINEKKLINIGLKKLDTGLFEEKNLFSELN